MTEPVAVPAPVTHLFYHPEARELAVSLGEHFHVQQRDRPPADQPGFHLWAVNDHLELRLSDERSGAWIPCAELARRAAQGSELRRACLGRGRVGSVLDVMAGWGMDGLMLAGAGRAVTLVERHPALSALQRDLVRRSAIDGVTCHCGDGFQVLSRTDPVDVVYLDPMFPARGKTALPGKRMQWTAALTTADPRPLAVWLEAAIGRANERVVLKRRRKDPVVRVPDWQVTGTTVRYDVYRGRAGY